MNIISPSLIVILAFAIASCGVEDPYTLQPAPATAVFPATPVSAQQQPIEVGIDIDAASGPDGTQALVTVTVRPFEALSAQQDGLVGVNAGTADENGKFSFWEVFRGCKDETRTVQVTASPGQPGQRIESAVFVITAPPCAEDELNRGNEYYNEGDYEAALAAFKRAIARATEDATAAIAHYYRGLTYEVMGDQDSAKADFDSAIELNSEYAIAYYSRALIHESQGDLELAVVDHMRFLGLYTEVDEFSQYALDRLRGLPALVVTLTASSPDEQLAQEAWEVIGSSFEVAGEQLSLILDFGMATEGLQRAGNTFKATAQSLEELNARGLGAKQSFVDEIGEMASSLSESAEALSLNRFGEAATSLQQFAVVFETVELGFPDEELRGAIPSELDAIASAVDFLTVLGDE